MKGYTQLLKGTGGKKYKMVFYDKMRKKILSVSFGDKNYQDYTQHQDMVRQQSYLARHKDNERWNEPMTAGACARWILWSRPTITEAYKSYRQRFGFELY
jgi:hypothetical protein